MKSVAARISRRSHDRVVIQPPALQDLDKAYDWTAERAPETASIWLSRFQAAIATLRDNPQRCAVASESRLVTYEIRQLVFGRRVGAFRVLFTIRMDTVRILHIRRAARDFLNAQDFPVEADFGD